MSRPSLGRGLAALIPSDLLAVSDSPRGALRMVPLDQIRPNPEQPRIVFNGPALEELAESIREHGVLTPLLVRRDERGGYVLIAGERRLRASGLAGMDEVPVWVREDVGTREQLELALVENLQREDLDPIETAESYRRLVEDFSMTQEAVARRVGKDRATVANAIRLLKLPEFVLQEVRAGRISAGHAKALLALPDETRLKLALQEILTHDLSVRSTEKLVTTLLKPRQRRAGEGPASSARLLDTLTRALGARVKVLPAARAGRGKIVIEYHSSEELERLVSHIASDR